MKDRINAIMRHMGMSQKDFANEICISPGTLSSIFSGRNKPTLNTLNNIRERFPEVNMDWLMNGNGEMFLSSASASPTPDSADGGSQSTPSSAQTQSVQPGYADPYQGLQQSAPQNPLSALGGKIFDKPSRKICEIRVFYDDGTYETFSPKS